MDYQQINSLLKTKLNLTANFDIVLKELTFAGVKASIYFVDGFVKDDIMEYVGEFLLRKTPSDLINIKSEKDFTDKMIAYVEVNIEEDYKNVIKAILSGSICLVVDGFQKAIIIDARTYPSRSVGEPTDDKVLRGSHDGFTETLIFNTALIRRRIRAESLVMERHEVGLKSKTDVVICYLSDKVDEKYLKKLQDKIKSIKVGALTMGQESLAECLVKRQSYNPFPKFKYTERPDVASACVLEGKIAVIVDNSPSIMILPVSFFDFAHEVNDFYFTPIVGTYLRLVRTLMFVVAIFLTPVWYFLILNPEIIPAWLNFIKVEDEVFVPIIVQLIAMEFVIDGIKQASLNTPSALTNSFSVVGALLLGELAIKVGWFCP
ncbi:MAG: spore germination protein, partial [Clostridia bacterium]